MGTSYGLPKDRISEFSARWSEKGAGHNGHKWSL